MTDDLASPISPLYHNVLLGSTPLAVLRHKRHTHVRDHRDTIA